MQLMKATKSFRGQIGEGTDGSIDFVRRGSEFRAASEARANAMERRGLAYRIVDTVPPPDFSPREEFIALPLEPIAPPGFPTGVATSQSSSLPDQAPPDRVSKRSERRAGRKSK